jgi:hypothetical protein
MSDGRIISHYLARERHWTVAALLVMAVQWVLYFIGMYTGARHDIWPRPLWFSCLVVLPMLLLTTCVGLQLTRRRMRRVMEAHQFMMCRYCGYELVGSPDDGLCPECGRGYAKSELRDDWRHRRPWPLSKWY